MLGQGPLQWLPKGRTPVCSTCAIPCSLHRHIGVLSRRTLSSQHAHVSLPWVPLSSMPVPSLCHRHMVAGGAAAAALKCQVGCAFLCRWSGCMCSKAYAYASYDAAHPGGPLAVTIQEFPTACAQHLRVTLATCDTAGLLQQQCPPHPAVQQSRRPVAQVSELDLHL